MIEYLNTQAHYVLGWVGALWWLARSLMLTAAFMRRPSEAGWRLSLLATASAVMGPVPLLWSSSNTPRLVHEYNTCKYK